MKPILLKFDPPVLDHIGSVLAERPYKEVKGILDNIVMMANNPELQGALDRLPEPKYLTDEQLAKLADDIVAEQKLRKGDQP